MATLPNDVLWERICVSRDMLDPTVCTPDNPPRFNTSIAVFKFTPADEHQLHPGRKIIYYKVTCTVTGFQDSSGIEGLVDFNSVGVSDFDLEKELQKFSPCHGAVLQVTVAPPADTPLDVEQFPYFLDFEPKQRTVYEQATDTKERVSRSAEPMTVRKDGGTTDSVEVLDAGEGFSVSAAEEQLRNATSSHATRLAELYTRFQAFHLGTNRALFTLAPRQHGIEDAMTAVDGPRPIEGIQEVFLVVSAPEDMTDPCLSVRLDTSHLLREETFEFDFSHADVPLAVDIDLPVPAKENGNNIRVDGDVDPAIAGFYDCVVLSQSQKVTSPPQPGFVVASVQEVSRQVFNGECFHKISNDKKTVTLEGQARSHACFRNEIGDRERKFSLARAILSLGADVAAVAMAAALADEVKNAALAFAHCAVRVKYRSEKPTVKTDERWRLLVTSRGLCCCTRPRPGARGGFFNGRLLTAVEDLEGDVTGILGSRRVTGDTPPRAPVRMTARQANAVADLVLERTRIIAARAASRLPEDGELERDYRLRRLAALAHRAGIVQLDSETPLPRRAFRKEWVARLATALGTETPTVPHVLTTDDATLARATGLAGSELTALRLAALGLPLRKR